MRAKLKSTFTAVWRLFVVPVLLLSALLAHAAPQKPNILLILADDLGWSDLGCYGGEIHTPNIDALAKDGLKFTQFYNMGRCCPSRACLMTGLYPHQVGVGAMNDDRGPQNPGYRGALQPNTATLAEVLRAAGYRTYMVGKWHLRNNHFDVKPTDRGFDEFYGMLGGFNSYWQEHPFYTRWPAGRPIRSYTSPQDGRPGTFYSTDVFADYAIDFLADARQSGKPFFLNLAFNAPHFPLHAHDEDIAKYEKTYFEKGWDTIREERLARQKQIGLLPKDLPLTPRSPVPPKSFAKQSPYVGKENPAWLSFPEDRRRDLARRMAAFAGAVDRLDKEVGRVIDDLKEHGEFDNTLILFLSDNGACWEWDPIGFDGSSGPNNVLHTGDDLQKVGGPASFISYGSAWANAGNTPWRLYKHFSHEGGVRTPFIVHWPAGMKARGEMRPQIGHLIDIMPTLVQVAGAKYPAQRDGLEIPPMEGRSLLPALKNKPIARSAPIFFEHEGSRAVRDGKWKLVSLSGNRWELYDMDTDPVEMVDLAAKMPKKVEAMRAQWEAWAKRCHVDTTTDFLSQNQDAPAIPTPRIAHRELNIRCAVAPESSNGVILAQGGDRQGYALHLSNARVVFSVRIDGALTAIMSPTAPTGPFKLEARLVDGGRMSLAINGDVVATGQAPGLIASQPKEGLDVGEDLGGAVGDYCAANPLKGRITDVSILALEPGDD